MMCSAHGATRFVSASVGLTLFDSCIASVSAARRADAWNVQMGDELSALNVGGTSWELFCREHGDGTMLSDTSISDDTYRPLWSETVDRMLCNAFALEPTAVDEGRAAHGDTGALDQVLCILEDDASPACFPVGEDALENATGRESPLVKRPGGGKKPQVRNVRMETRCLHTSSLLTAHTAHARVVPTCQRPLRAS